MRIPVLALGFAWLLLSHPLQAQPKAGAWQAFAFAPGGYKVAFPAAPVMSQGKLRSASGEIVSTRHTADGANATYDVTYNDYPRDAVARLNPETLLDTVRDGLIYQSNGNLASEKPFKFGELTGREAEIAGGDGTRYRIRLLLVGNRLYQLTAMAKPPVRPEAQKFFNSFRLTR